MRSALARAQAEKYGVPLASKKVVVASESKLSREVNWIPCSILW
jgi:hypothetical protein